MARRLGRLIELGADLVDTLIGVAATEKDIERSASAFDAHASALTALESSLGAPKPESGSSEPKLVAAYVPPAEVPQCLGCAVKHIADAKTLLDEASSFYQRGDREMADAHAVSALGELREAEKQSQKWPEISSKVREIRKKLEAKLVRAEEVAGSDELTEIAVEALALVRTNPKEYCPTCEL